MHAGPDQCVCYSPDEKKQTQDLSDLQSDQVEYARVVIDLGKWNKANPNNKLGVFRCHNKWFLAPIEVDGTLNIPLHTPAICLHCRFTNQICWFAVFLVFLVFSLQNALSFFFFVCFNTLNLSCCTNIIQKYQFHSKDKVPSMTKVTL